MTWQQALHWCIDNPGKLVRDKDGNAHIVSIDSGSPNLRCEGWKARPFDPSGESYSVDELSQKAIELKVKIDIQKRMEQRGGLQ